MIWWYQWYEAWHQTSFGILFLVTFNKIASIAAPVSRFGLNPRVCLPLSRGPFGVLLRRQVGLAGAHAGAGSDFGRSRRAILVVPEHTEWHSWQSEAWERSRAPKTTDWGVAEQTGCGGWQPSAADGGRLCRFGLPELERWVTAMRERAFGSMLASALCFFWHHGRVLLTAVHRVCMHWSRHSRFLPAYQPTRILARRQRLGVLSLPFPCGDHVCLFTRKSVDTF